MSKFTDANGRDWQVTLTVGLLRPLRELGFGLDELKGTTVGGLAFAEPEKLVEVAWLLCEAQADKAGVTPEQFGAGFDGDTLDRFADAFMGAVLLFFPSLRRLGPALAAKRAVILEAVTAEAVKALPTDEAIRTGVASAMRSNGTAGSSPDSSG